MQAAVQLLCRWRGKQAQLSCSAGQYCAPCPSPRCLQRASTQQCILCRNGSEKRESCWRKMHVSSQLHTLTVLLHHKMPPDTSCCSPPVCRMSTLGRGFVTTIVGLCTGCLPCLRRCCSNPVLGLSGPSAADSTAARLRLGVNAAVLVPLPEASVDVAVLTSWVWSCTHATTPRLARTAVNEGARHRCLPCESSRAVRCCMERWTAVVVQNDVASGHPCCRTFVDRSINAS